MPRKILHIDMNNFYASVELLSKPELQEKPVAVGGDASQRHGIILAKNEIAKSYGIKTAETIHSAKKKCPNLILLPAQHQLYAHYSQLAKEIYLSYTPRVQSFGPDEAWLDVSEHQAAGKDIALSIQQRVWLELGLPASVGISDNKTWAKMASDHQKPRGLTEINRENYQRILWPKPVEELLYVGKVTAEKLQSYGIFTIKDLALSKPEFLEQKLGILGLRIWQGAHGLDEEEVPLSTEQESAKSIGAMRTTPYDLEDQEIIYNLFSLLSAEVWERLTREKLQARCVRITVRFNDFSNYTRQMSLSRALASQAEVLALSWQLFQEEFPQAAPVRLLGVTLDQVFDPQDNKQVSLAELTTEAKNKPQDQVQELLAELQELYGAEIIKKGFE